METIWHGQEIIAKEGQKLKKVHTELQHSVKANTSGHTVWGNSKICKMSPLVAGSTNNIKVSTSGTEYQTRIWSGVSGFTSGMRAAGHAKKSAMGIEMASLSIMIWPTELFQRSKRISIGKYWGVRQENREDTYGCTRCLCVDMYDQVKTPGTIDAEGWIVKARKDTHPVEMRI